MLRVPSLIRMEDELYIFCDLRKGIIQYLHSTHQILFLHQLLRGLVLDEIFTIIQRRRDSTVTILTTVIMKDTYVLLSDLGMVIGGVQPLDVIVIGRTR